MEVWQYLVVEERISAQPKLEQRRAELGALEHRCNELGAQGWGLVSAAEAARFRASGNQVRAEQWTQRVEQTLLAAQIQLGPPELRLATALEQRARGQLGEARAQLAASGLARAPEDWRALNADLEAVVPERYPPHPHPTPVPGPGDTPARPAG